jgi:hypothetical protein
MISTCKRGCGDVCVTVIVRSYADGPDTVKGGVYAYAQKQAEECDVDWSSIYTLQQ